MDWFSLLIVGVPLFILLMVLAIWVVSLFPSKKRAIKVVRQFTLQQGGKELPGPSFGLSKTEQDDFFQKQLGEKSSWYSRKISRSILFRGTWKKDGHTFFCTLYMYWRPVLLGGGGTKPTIELVITSENGKRVEYPNLFGVVPTMEKINILYDQLLKS